MRRQYSRRVIGETLLCFVHHNMFRLLDMNFQSSKFKLQKFVNSWEREMNSTSYSMTPKSCVAHAQLDKHIWWRPIKFFFGGCVDTTLHGIGERKWNFHPRPQSSGKKFFWTMGIKASSPSCRAARTCQKLGTIMVPWQLQH